MPTKSVHSEFLISQNCMKPVREGQALYIRIELFTTYLMFTSRVF